MADHEPDHEQPDHVRLREIARELACCQGFPDDYKLTGTKTSQVARIGNSVCPDVVEALVRANYTEQADA